MLLHVNLADSFSPLYNNPYAVIYLFIFLSMNISILSRFLPLWTILIRRCMWLHTDKHMQECIWDMSWGRELVDYMYTHIHLQSLGSHCLPQWLSPCTFSATLDGVPVDLHFHCSFQIWPLYFSLLKKYRIPPSVFPSHSE